MYWGGTYKEVEPTGVKVVPGTAAEEPGDNEAGRAGYPWIHM